MCHALRATGLLIGLAGWGAFGAGMSTAQAQAYYDYYRPTPTAYVAPTVRYYVPAAATPRTVYYRVAPRQYPAYIPQPAMPYRYAVPTASGMYRPARPLNGYRPYAPAANPNPHWTDDTNTLIQDSL